MTDLVIVGSGLFGLTIAERAASQLGLKVLIIEKRSHIGGNAYSEFDPETGIEIHKYGSHIFHTSNEKVWAYVNQFTSFNNYQHKVWAKHNDLLFPMPINLETINKFFNLTLTEDEAKTFMESQSNPELARTANNLEDRAIGLVGRPLYDAFIKNYTLKQWQVNPRELPAEIINRLPINFGSTHRYFNDKYEGIPSKGYTNWLTNMLNHPKIDVKTNVDFLPIKGDFIGSVPVVYTGPIDRFFNYLHGTLAWRTLDFEFEVTNVSDYQGNSVINYSDLDVPFTRIHEFKHFHPEVTYVGSKSIICREYSRIAEQADEPYYPVNTPLDRATLAHYRREEASLSSVIFGGRLGTYQYLDMHMAIASALSTFENKLKPIFDGINSL